METHCRYKFAQKLGKIDIKAGRDLVAAKSVYIPLTTR